MYNDNWQDNKWKSIHLFSMWYLIWLGLVIYVRLRQWPAKQIVNHRSKLFLGTSLTRTAPRAISLENHKKKIPVWGPYASRWWARKNAYDTTRNAYGPAKTMRTNFVAKKMKMQKKKKNGPYVLTSHSVNKYIIVPVRHSGELSMHVNILFSRRRTSFVLRC